MTRVFTLEARLTRETEQRLRGLCREQNRYRNHQVEIQRKRADEYQEIRRGFDPRLAEIDSELERLAKEDKRRGLDDDERAQRKALEAEAKPLRKAFNERLTTGNAEIKRRKEGKYTHQAKAAHEQAVAQMVKGKWPKEWKAVAASELAAHALELDARSESGLRQALYTAPDAELQAARAAAVKSHVPCHPDFVHFEGEGRVKIQMRTGHQPVVKDGRIAVVTHDVEIREMPRRLPDEHRHPRQERDPTSKRPRKRFFDVRLRVSNEAGAEWLECSAMAHREIPDGTIAWVNLIAKHRGARIRYQLQLELKSDAWERPPQPQAKDAVAVHLGWASNGDGTYRVGYALGTDGETEELVLDLRRSTDTGERRDLSGIDHARSLRAAQDLNFEAARAAMVEWLKTKPVEAKSKYTYRDHLGEHSTCLREECKEIAKWRAPWKLRRAAGRLAAACGIESRLPALWEAWKRARLAKEPKLDLLDASEVIVAWAAKHGVKTQAKHLAVYLAFWSRKSLHLEGWVQDEWRQARNRRKDEMRTWWRKLERRYAVAVVAEWDLTEIPSATRKRTDEDEQTRAARRNRASCAPGEMREIGKQAMGKARWEDAPAGEHSARCSLCGKKSLPHPGVKTATCSCGLGEDRSLRWCKNVLAARAERSEAAE